MSEALRSACHDEVDLFELIQTLWKDKLWINASMSVADADEVINRVLNILPAGWEKEQKPGYFSFETLIPKDIAAYKRQFHDITQRVSTTLLQQAHSDVEIVLNELPETLQSTEAVAIQMLDAKKTARALAEGVSAIEFISPSITQIEPKKLLILASSIILGSMVGVMFVLVRSTVCNRRK